MLQTYRHTTHGVRDKQGFRLCSHGETTITTAGAEVGATHSPCEADVVAAEFLSCFSGLSASEAAGVAAFSSSQEPCLGQSMGQ